VFVLSVGLSVCPLVTIVNSGKTADSIEMPLGIVGRVDPVNDVLDGVQIALTGRGIFLVNYAAQSRKNADSATLPHPKLIWDFVFMSCAWSYRVSRSETPVHSTTCGPKHLEVACLRQWFKFGDPVYTYE